MTKHITVTPVEGTWVVRAGGAVIGETNAALELQEGSYPSVIYVPRADMAMAFLEKTDHSTVCPHKGTASYFSIVTKSKTLKNVVWSYEDPKADVAAIKDHLAFYLSEDVTVEEV